LLKGDLSVGSVLRKGGLSGEMLRKMEKIFPTIKKGNQLYSPFEKGGKGDL